MDLLLILRDALASSLVGNLLLALRAREAGQTVGVLLTQEALAAVTAGTFSWPRELAGQQMRLTIADRGTKQGLPVRGRGEGRQLDVKALITKAGEAGVQMYACPLWTSLLDLSDALPDGVQSLDEAGLLAVLGGAKRIVGTL